MIDTYQLIYFLCFTKDTLLFVFCMIFCHLSFPEKYSSYIDDYCLALLLKGVCQKHRGQFLQAEQCFLEVLEKYDDLLSQQNLNIHVFPWVRAILL